MRIAKDNGKIGLYETNKVRIYKPVSGTMSVGYDNVTPSPYVNTNYYFLVKHKFDTIYTGGEMAIRIPLETQSGTVNIQQRLTPATDPNNTRIQVWKYSVVGENPPYGFDNYISNPGSRWGTRSTSTYIEYFTTDAAAIAGLNTTEYFWFGIDLRTQVNFFYRGILSYYEGNYNSTLRRYLRYNTIDHYLKVEIIDTSHA
jgi:hypothetical protein